MSMDARTIDLQALRIFKAVVDEGSVTRAASQLHDAFVDALVAVGRARKR